MTLNFKNKEENSLSSHIKIGTHNGRFHADEVIATQLLQFILENDHRPSEIELVRTRDQKVIDKCDMVVDVGKIYDHEKHRYDHHQESCQETFSPTTPIPLSSAGLIWRHYGQQFITIYLEKYHPEIYQESLLNGAEKENNPPDRSHLQDSHDHDLDEIGSPTLPTLVEELYIKFYYRFIQEIDGHDNGVPAIKNEHYHPEMYNYFQNLHLGNSISNLNHTDPSDHQKQYTQFCIAQELAFQVLKIHLDDMVISKWQYLKEQNGIEKTFHQRVHRYLLVMDENYVSWREHLKRLDPHNEIKFTVYPRNSEKTQWGFSTNQSTRFQNEIDLLSEEQLQTLLEQPTNLTFVHKNLFCGAASTQESAIQVCVLSYQHNAPKILTVKEKAYTLIPSLVGSLTLIVGSIFIYKKYIRN